MSATITNWIYESQSALKAKALIALAKAKELERIKQSKNK